MPTETIELMNEVSIDKPAVDTSTSKYLTFFSDGLLFGVNASQVVEIIINHAITPMPMTPQYVKGIINLRGQIIPIIDARLRMGRTASEDNSAVCIIVLNIDGTQVGILVDRVAQMVDIDESAISSGSTGNKDQNLVNGMISLPDSGETILIFDCLQLINQT